MKFNIVLVLFKRQLSFLWKIFMAEDYEGIEEKEVNVKERNVNIPF
jgi:hypothetical protein